MLSIMSERNIDGYAARLGDPALGMPSLKLFQFHHNFERERMSQAVY